MKRDLKDITIVGGGPTGLFGAFYAGLRGLSTRIIDSLPDLGGQLVALYPEKYIYDVGGIPKILAKDLARDMIEQGLQFGPEVFLDQQITELVSEGENFILRGPDAEFLTRSVLISGGKGAFEPRHLDCPGYSQFLGEGVIYMVEDPKQLKNRKILVVGGGDSALDWVLALKDTAEEITIIHRREEFRAHEDSVRQLQLAVGSGRVSLKTFHEVREIHGDKTVEGVTIFDNKSNEESTLDVDVVLCLLGFKPDLGPIKSWGLDLERNRLSVDSLMMTSQPGVFGAGDLVSYEGKLDLIATGFSEAAIAVNNIVRHLDPKARVNPGHSTNLKIFKDK
jgi:thioredoxin reductase (NADPH)